MTRKNAKDGSDAHGSEVPQAPETDTAGDQVEGDELLVDPLEAALAERDDLLARLQRVSADYTNYQKRARRDVEQVRLFANEDLIKALLPVIDDVERALLAALENHGQDDPLFTGMQLVHDKALDTLGRFGVKVIEAVGKPFDPQRHTALRQQPTDECEANTVLQEMQRGYELRGRTLRPATVVVSTAPEAPGDEAEAET